MDRVTHHHTCTCARCNGNALANVIREEQIANLSLTELAHLEPARQLYDEAATAEQTPPGAP